MRAGESNRERDNKKYSKIDLDDIDSWLPPDVAQSLARMIASRNRKQHGAGLEADGAREWKDMPQVGRDYHALLASGSLEPEEANVDGGELEVSPLNEGVVEDRDDAGDSPAEEVPFYY